MKQAIPHFPLSSHHRDLAIVGLAQAGGTVREIANDVEVSINTVRRVLKVATVAPGWGYGMRKFLISGIQWDTSGRVLERLPLSGTIVIGIEDWGEVGSVDYGDMLVHIGGKFGDQHGYCLGWASMEELLPGDPR